MVGFGRRREFRMSKEKRGVGDAISEAVMVTLLNAGIARDPRITRVTLQWGSAEEPFLLSQRIQDADAERREREDVLVSPAKTRKALR